MSNGSVMRSPFDRAVRAAVAGGVDALIAMQDADGLWREFSLAPGAAEAWPTAWVGWCLRGCEGAPVASHEVTPRETSRQRRSASACARAAHAVNALRRPEGWGYNHSSGADADSTAWALRFLAACGTVVDPLPWLSRFVDAGGGVHTFTDAGYGSWTDAHDDVAANVGLALLQAGSSRPLAHRIAQRLTQRWPIPTFWWATPTYGWAWGLRLLAALPGGIPAAVRAQASSALAALPPAADAFQIAHRLMIATRLAEARPAEKLSNELLDLADGGAWRGGTYLLVPPRDSDAVSTTAMAAAASSTPNPELRGLLTTSISVLALTEFLAARMGWR